MELQVAITDLKVSYKGVFDFCKYFIRKEDVSCARVHDALVVVELRGEEGRRRGQGKGDGRRREGAGNQDSKSQKHPEPCLLACLLACCHIP